jgi:hypothetical protein
MRAGGYDRCAPIRLPRVRCPPLHVRCRWKDRRLRHVYGEAMPRTQHPPLTGRIERVLGHAPRTGDEIALAVGYTGHDVPIGQALAQLVSEGLPPSRELRIVLLPLREQGEEFIAINRHRRGYSPARAPAATRSAHSCAITRACP